MGSQRVRHDWATKYNTANAEDVRDAGWIPGSGRSPGGGNGNLLQYSCPENSVDRGNWQGWTQLSGWACT